MNKTIRNKLNTSFRRTLVAQWGGFFLVCLGVILGYALSEVFVSIALIGFVVLVIGMLYMLYGIRCPRCKRMFGNTIHYPFGRLFSISEKVKFCPFCGVKIDSKIDA